LDIKSPEELDKTLISLDQGRDVRGRAMYDADGDGIEDNSQLTAEQRDKFYWPARMFPADHVYNTRHGGLPGERQKYFYDQQSEPLGHASDLVKKDW